ncbi:ATP-grasp domain-containing protein [Amycolatopsis australiensis]|uniref:[lysine-biosynthesis-protein LysW]---L-2-aminoadipate ligase n=1 Tax=Amycolatopsis australiensis TaxID=546364 RepID=A0A1K1SQH5_9PSEU|nr:RimK family alpha-L-glutamate ligase [Amycolatopsis australiensis]SFW86569.1 [lysine-biosynthesis-protein LysW]---L-2-aminoadipate ligase [Amycolatopsis australiensis]
MSRAERVAIVADRVGWEERELTAELERRGVDTLWLNDESLGLGVPSTGSLNANDLVLIRSRSYTRGGLLASNLAAHGVLTINSAGAIHASENKLLTRSVLHENNIPVPEFRLVLSRKDFHTVLEELPLPLVIKPVFGGMGRRVFLIRDADTAQSLYDYIDDLGHAFEQACLVERYLGSHSIRCLVAGHEIVAAAEFENSSDGEWRSNAATGSTQRGLAHSAELRQIVERVIDVLGPGIYGVDLFDHAGSLVVNEVNHTPAFRAISEISEVDIVSVLGGYLQTSLS